MRHSMRLFLVSGVILSSAPCYAQTLLTDDFSGSSVDASLWTVSEPFSDSVSGVSDGNVNLANGAGLLSTGSFLGSFEIDLSFAFTGTGHDSFRVYTRSDGFSASGYGGSGVGVSFRIQEDTGNLVGNVALEDNGVVLTTGTISLTTNAFYDIRLVDTGSSIDLFWNNETTPFLTAATTSNYGDGILMFNREGEGNGSFISAGSVTSISGLSVSAIPESATWTSLAGLAVLLVGLHLRMMKHY